MGPHCSQVLYLWIQLLTKMHLYPQLNTCIAFMVFHRYAQCGKKNLSHTTYTFPDEVKYSKILPCFSSHTINGVFYSPFSAMLFACLTFCWWLCCWRWPLRVVRMLRSPRRLWRALWRKHVCWVNFVQAWVTVLLGMSSILRSQKYVLSKASLNRSIHKRRSYIDWLMKLLWLETHRNLLLYFPQGPTKISSF